MSAEQIAGLMAPNFFHCKTMIINQSVHVLNPDVSSKDQEVTDVFEEKILLKFPDLYYVEVTGHEIGNISTDNISGYPISKDMIFRRLFILNDNGDSIVNFLKRIGINVEAVAFTRFNGVIAYRIGDAGPDSPKLLVEKEKFRPLYLTYCLHMGMKDMMVKVSFDDYRKTKKGWYPFKITYSRGESVIKRYFMLKLGTDISVENYPLKKITEKTICGRSQDIKNNETDQEESHLREVFKALEQKNR